MHFLTVHAYPMRYEPLDAVWDMGRVNLRNGLRWMQRFGGRGPRHLVYGIVAMGRYARVYWFDRDGSREVVAMHGRAFQVAERSMSIEALMDMILLNHI